MLSKFDHSEQAINILDSSDQRKHAIPDAIFKQETANSKSYKNRSSYRDSSLQMSFSPSKHLVDITLKQSSISNKSKSKRTPASKSVESKLSSGISKTDPFINDSKLVSMKRVTYITALSD